MSFALVALLASAPAQATTVRALSVKDLAALSEVVVHGVVQAADARWAGGRIVTDVVVAARTVFAGRVKVGEPVALTVLGGEVAGIGQVVLGAPRLSAGDEVLLFLERRPAGLVVAGVGLGCLRMIGPGVASRPDDPDLGAGLTLTFGDVRGAVRP